MRRKIFIDPDTPLLRLGGRLPRAALVLLLVHLGVFLAFAFANGPEWLARNFAASGEATLGRLNIWQLLTGLWLHLGTRGLLLNMLSLWIFGSALERWWGSRRFVLFWVVTGATGLAAGALVGLAFAPTVLLAGTAGSAAAVIVAVGLIFPRHLVFFYGVLPLQARYLVLIMLGFVLIGSIAGGAHLEAAVEVGGGLAAVLFLLRRRPGQGSGTPRRPTKAPRSARGRGRLRVLDGGKKNDDEPKLWN